MPAFKIGDRVRVIPEESPPHVVGWPGVIIGLYPAGTPGSTPRYRVCLDGDDEPLQLLLYPHELEPETGSPPQETTAATGPCPSDNSGRAGAVACRPPERLHHKG
jgi:hypothetical protein